ncbi:ABC transporter substrate-binding protein, partial [Rhodococcus hoagii]|nr:ABC transporter substrate-binding protein [Prescottella equi]
TKQRGRTTAVVADADPRPVSNDPVPQLPVTVRSFDGVDVTVTDASRIVTADRYGTLTETVFALGLGDNVVGRDTASAFPAAKDIPNVTPGGQAMNAEAILNLAPTVVLTDTSIGPKSVQDQLRAAGVPVIFFDPTRTLAGVPGQITAVAQALGVPARESSSSRAPNRRSRTRSRTRTSRATTGRRTCPARVASSRTTTRKGGHRWMSLSGSCSPA